MRGHPSEQNTTKCFDLSTEEHKVNKLVGLKHQCLWTLYLLSRKRGSSALSCNL